MQWMRLALFTICMSLVAAACGSAQPTAVPATSTSAPAATSRPTTGATQATPTIQATSAPVPTATLVPTATALTPLGELTVAVSTLGASALYPGIGSGGGAAFGGYWRALYDQHLNVTPEGTLDPASSLVTSWTANADSTMWTFKVRDNLNFHNGEKATAQDLAFAIGLGLDPKSDFPRSGDLRSSVTGVTTPDDATVVVNLKGTDILWNLTYISRLGLVGYFPQLVISKKHAAAVGTDGYNKNPLSSGPYKFKSVAVGDRIVMEAIDRHFFYGVPRTKSLTFMSIPEESTRVSLLKTGAADITPISIANEKSITGQTGLRVAVDKGAQIAILWNGQYPDVIPGKGPNPFANVMVRKALFWHAIDRQALVDSFFGGRGTASMDYPVVKRDPYVFDKPLPVPAYDPTKAKAMLAEAGFRNGFDVDIYLSTVPSNTPEVMEAVAVYWEKVGIRVKRIPFTGAGFTNAVVGVYQKDGFATPTVSGIIAGGIGNFTLSSSTALLQGNAQAAYSVNRDPEGLRLALAFTNSKTIDEYKRNGQAYRQYAYEQASTYVMLYEVDTLWGASSKVTTKWRIGAGGEPERYVEAAALR